MRSRRYRLLFALLVGLGSCALTGPVPAQAAGTWYVTPAGRDDADCLSPETACGSIGGALGKAGPGDTVILAPGRYPETLQLRSSVTIVGAGAGESIIDGEGRGSVVSVNQPGLEVVLRGLTVRGGRSVGAGGGITNSGALIIEQVSVESNAVSLGEGFQGLGGGIANFGALTLRNTAVLSNTGVTGGGIFSQGTLNATNVTLSANNAAAQGGGLAVGRGTATLRFTTVTGNSAGEGAGGLFAAPDSSLRIGDGILTGNIGATAPECRGAVNSDGFNVLGSLAGCAFAAVGGDLFDADARLGALGAYGGPTLTIPLLEGSAAIDLAFAGRCPPADQRGVARPQGKGCDAGAFEREMAEPPPPPVRLWYVSPEGADSEACGAIEEPCRTIGATLTRSGPRDVVNLAPGRYSETLQLRADVTIVGAGAQASIIDGAGRGGVVAIFSRTVRARLADLSVRGGQAVGAGGGITNFGALELERVSVQENAVSLGEGFQGLGGGIANFGTLVVSATAVISNSAYIGAGIYSSGTLSVTNSTVSGNAARVDGGGIAAERGEVALAYSTVANNRSDSDDDGTGDGGGLFVAAVAAAEATGALLAANADPGGQAPDCNGVLLVAFTSLVGSSMGCDVRGAGAITQADPRIGPLAANGGPTLTHALLKESPAIDAGPGPTCPATDQRGEPRPQGEQCDLGAFEADVPSGPPDPYAYYVSPAGDDANNCRSAASPCATIAAALARAADGDSIKVGLGRYAERLTIRADVTLVGAGPGATIVDGGGEGTTISVSRSAEQARIVGMTITGGGQTETGGGVQNQGGLLIERSVITGNRAASLGSTSRGGGIANLGTLVLRQTVVMSNTALYGGGIANSGVLSVTGSVVHTNIAVFGGGVFNSGTGTFARGALVGNGAVVGGGALNVGSLSLSDSTVAGNLALLGAGIANLGHLTVVNSTIYDNTAFEGGGGLQNGPLAVARLEGVTIAKNRTAGSGAGAGVLNTDGGTLELHNTLLAANLSADGQASDCQGAVRSLGYNLIEELNGCLIAAQNRDRIGVDARLGEALRYGAHIVIGLEPGSPAIDAADPSRCVPADQRGVPRPQRAACDIGAFEAPGRPGWPWRVMLPLVRV